jgi:hypothetical protein
LVTQADAHDRKTVLDGSSQCIASGRGLSGMRRVAWAIAAEQRVNGVLLSQPVVVDVRGTPDDVEDHAKVAEDVVFDTTIQDAKPGFGSPEFIGRTWVEFKRLVNGDFVDQIFQFGGGQGAELSLHFVLPLQGTKDAKNGPKFTNTASNRSCVDVVNPRYAMKAKEFIHGANRRAMVGLVHSMTNNNSLGPNIG